MPRDEPAHLLILGGTAEALALAHACRARFGAKLALTNSLAGRTRRPVRPPGRLRVGGFGGADGLARYLRRAAVDIVVDATHPFAAAISANARAACETLAVPRLSLARPMWARAPGDRWIEVADAAGAAAALGRLDQRRVFLSLGHQGLEAFAGMAAHWFLIRLVEPPDRPPPLDRHLIMIGRGPFTLADERLMLAEHRIGAVVCKASGGGATEAKILASRALGLPVIMLRRPPAEPGRRVAGVDAALDWIAGRLDRRSMPDLSEVAAQ